MYASPQATDLQIGVLAGRMLEPVVDAVLEATPIDRGVLYRQVTLALLKPLTMNRAPIVYENGDLVDTLRVHLGPIIEVRFEIGNADDEDAPLLSRRVVVARSDIDKTATLQLEYDARHFVLDKASATNRLRSLLVLQTDA